MPDWAIAILRLPRRGFQNTDWLTSGSPRVALDYPTYPRQSYGRPAQKRLCLRLLPGSLRPDQYFFAGWGALNRSGVVARNGAATGLPFGHTGMERGGRSGLCHSSAPRHSCRFPLRLHCWQRRRFGRVDTRRMTEPALANPCSAIWVGGDIEDDIVGAGRI